MRSRRTISVTRRLNECSPHNLQLVRRWLISVPARVVHRAGQVFKRTYVRLTR